MPREVVEARDVGQRGRCSAPLPSTSARAVASRRAGCARVQSPARLVERRAPLDLGVEAEVRAQAVLVGAVLEVREDLAAAAPYVRDQRGFGSNENEYRCDGTSQAAPG